MNILSINKLCKNYHTKSGEIKAVDNFDLDVSKGEIIAIVGPSGCGKSTILSTLCGLEKKTSGEIKYNKQDFKIGYMLQRDSLFPWLNILDNCLLGIKVKGKVTDEDKSRVIRLLDTYGLKDFKSHYPSELSGGMKQRVALIRTLAINPDILLLDEPFSALDYQTRLALSDDIYNIIKKENKTVIMVTHDIAEAISMADRIVVVTKRPASIKSIYDIKLTDKKNPIHNRNAKEFTTYYNLIWKDLDIHV